MNKDTEYIEWLKKLGQEQDIFYFKQFQVRDDQSTMKVGTDAVLLGIAAETGGASRILEIGTGCGVIALILAQRSEALVDAVEIDEGSVLQARENVAISPWPHRVHVIHSPLQEYLKICQVKYDLVISNPPFFTRSFRSDTERRNLSRHDDRLTFDELLEGARLMLQPQGQLWVILPVREGIQFRHKAMAAGFHIQQTLHIIPRKGKDANRIIMSFGRQKADRIKDTHLTLRDENNEFSEEYKTFAHDFYIDF